MGGFLLFFTHQSCLQANVPHSLSQLYTPDMARNWCSCDKNIRKACWIRQTVLTLVWEVDHSLPSNWPMAVRLQYWLRPRVDQTRLALGYISLAILHLLFQRSIIMLGCNTNSLCTGLGGGSDWIGQRCPSSQPCQPALPSFSSLS